MGESVMLRKPGSRARLELVCGPAPTSVQAETVIFDPPWDAVPDIDVCGEWVIAFTDAQFFGDTISRFGPPAWLFVWDAVSCFNLPRRPPLKRAKLAVLYGDLDIYDKDVARNDRVVRKVSARREVLPGTKQSRGAADSG